VLILEGVALCQDVGVRVRFFSRDNLQTSVKRSRTVLAIMMEERHSPVG
jgi:hypothetical protein